MKNKRPLAMKNIILCLSIIFLFVSCKKETDDSSVKGNFFSSGGKSYAFQDFYKNCKFQVFDCFTFSENGGIIYNKVPGMQLVLLTDRNNPFGAEISVTLSLFGEEKGTYSGISNLCGNNRIRNSSMVQTSDGKHASIFGDGTVTITEKKGNLVSGKFSMKMAVNKEFLNDSLISGEFTNIPLQ
ncbi:MAG: hypothetical protein LCH37_08010 [Bacteroidetes bacterium]|nr:hypothetical protein [Bacteroidota bacterium]MCK6611930.1 hypothetical protein [Bacteroidia bacterium]